MAITSLDGVIAGCKPPQMFYKALSGTLVAGRPHTPFYTAGIPGPAVAPTPGLTGSSITSYSGQIPFTNPTGGLNSYLARFTASATQAGVLLLVDRLWHNSGFTITSTGAQTINSGNLTTRDANGTSNGDGVLLGVEISSTTGAGTPTITVFYNNQANVTKSAANVVNTVASSITGSFYPIALAAGDTGVRSVANLTLSATWTSGTMHLVAYRVLAQIDVTPAGGTIDALTGGLPRMYDNTVPQLIFIPNTTTTSTISGMMTVTQG